MSSVPPRTVPEPRGDASLPLRAWRRVGQGLAVALVLGLLGPGAVAAQWAEGAGDYWAKVSVFHHRTDTQYRSDGNERPFVAAGAESVSTGIFLDLLYGVTDRLDLWAQVPYFDLSFDDVTADRDESGIGDVRLMARYQLLSLRGGSIPVALRVGAKWPILDSPIDAEVIPVGEGQWDIDTWLETGISFHPFPAYAILWLGYRFRFENETTRRDPGDERLLLAEVGSEIVGPVGGKLTLDVIDGTSGTLEGIAGEGDEREIVYLQPSLTAELSTDLSLEGGVRIPLRGRNFPAGEQIVVGLFYRPGG